MSDTWRSTTLTCPVASLFQVSGKGSPLMCLSPVVWGTVVVVGVYLGMETIYELHALLNEWISWGQYIVRSEYRRILSHWWRVWSVKHKSLTHASLPTPLHSFHTSPPYPFIYLHSPTLLFTPPPPLHYNTIQYYLIFSHTLSMFNLEYRPEIFNKGYS